MTSHQTGTTTPAARRTDPLPRLGPTWSAGPAPWLDTRIVWEDDELDVALLEVDGKPGVRGVVEFAEVTDSVDVTEAARRPVRWRDMPGPRNGATELTWAMSQRTGQ
jgi:hypothetical protein